MRWFNKSIPEIPKPVVLEPQNDGVIRCEDCGKNLTGITPLVAPDSDIEPKIKKTPVYVEFPARSGRFEWQDMIENIPRNVCKECWYKAFKKMHPDIEPAYYV